MLLRFCGVHLAHLCMYIYIFSNVNECGINEFYTRSWGSLQLGYMEAS